MIQQITQYRQNTGVIQMGPFQQELNYETATDVSQMSDFFFSGNFSSFHIWFLLANEILLQSDDGVDWNILLIAEKL